MKEGPLSAWSGSKHKPSSALGTNPTTSQQPTSLHPLPCQQPSIYHIASNTPPPPCRGSSHASVGLRRKEWRNGAFMEIRLSTIFPIRYGNISPLPTPAGRPNICSPYSDFPPNSKPFAQFGFEHHSDLFSVWIFIC